MYLHFEQNISSRTECTIHSLSWMGKVPDCLPGDTSGGLKLNRSQYYSEGWLASGNAKGIVGVTFTASHCRKYDPPNRSNFNLRGHRSEVVLVRWNEPYQKLATCDAQGIIFVWIKHEGRWSIELINDRNSQVTDFAWSHDGRMALICYCDGFVLVGSVAGQRYWSSMLNLDSTAITCGVWTPDDQKVIFGTTDGQIIVMSATGAMVTQITILEGMEITSLLWSCEKFNMEETEGNQEAGNKDSSEPESGKVMISDDSSSLGDKNYVLAVSFKYGAIYLMDNYDDQCPKIVRSMLTGLKIDWSNCGQYLAVGGFTRLPNLLCRNEIHFYSASGVLIHLQTVPSQGKPLTALCWGHNDRRLFVAAGHCLHVAWIIKSVPSLQYLCQRSVQQLVRFDYNVEKLPLPVKLAANVRALFTPTIKSYIPDPFKLRAFVSTPPPGLERLFCTMIHHGEEPSGGHYTLYLEYLGGLIPLLKGKRASKLRPDFIIFDPRIKATKNLRKEGESGSCLKDDIEIISDSTSSDSDIETDGCGGSPRVPRRKRLRHFRAEKMERSTTFRTLNELLYNDNLPESSKMVEVTSNIWGTKFRIVGTAAHLPEDLGNVLYKTSLLHLQPRQMTVTVTELPRDDSLLAQDSNFTPAGDSEDDELSLLDGLLSGAYNEHYSKNNIPTHLDSLTNQNSEIISVDLLSNHMELSNYAENETEIGSTVNCYDRQKTVCMKTKLSPASETHPQNNHAFNTGEEEPLIISACSYGGARPKVPLHSSYTNQAVTEMSGIIGVTNHVNNSKLYSSGDNGAKSVTSQSESSAKDKVSSHALHESNTEIVGDYFFADKNSVDSRKRKSHSASAQSDSPDSVQKHVPSFVDRFIRSDTPDSVPRWADPACQGIKFADDDEQSVKDLAFEGNIVFDSSLVVTPTSDGQKRLYLEGCIEQESIVPADEKLVSCEDRRLSHDKKMVNKRGSFDFADNDTIGYVNLEDNLNSDTESLMKDDRNDDVEKASSRLNKKRKSSLLSDFERFGITETASMPSSPLHKLHKPDSPTRKLKEELLHGKCKHHSPLFKRKSKFSRSVETSEEECGSSVEDVRLPYNFKNLESFQKAQFKQKLKKALNRGEKTNNCRQFVLHNKAPLWNENSQVYQLDFGGRVTQESAKNFQVEHRGRQVMQFGRIDSNAYTLDFQYPFTAIQAFAVALANVTQRLK